jgi:GxxExxY protein
MSRVLHLPEEVFRIQGALFEVYKLMGPGFLESVYQECVQLEFAKRKIPFEAMPKLKITYKGELLETHFSPDLVCFSQVLIELKAVKGFAPEHRAQVINYLRASGMKLGLLVNFHSAPRVQIERFAL